MTLNAQDKYRSYAGTSNPNLLIQAARASPNASLSRYEVHASPGNISTPIKVIKDTINNVIKPNTNLLKIKKNIFQLINLN